MGAAIDNRLADSALAGLVEGLAIVDDDGTIVFWNERASDFLGLRAEEWLGREASTLYPVLAGFSRDPRATMQQLQAAVASSEKTPSVALELTSPRPRFIEAQWFPLRGGNEAGKGYGILFRDVTREKELDQMKNQLLSIVSHELRTPLAAIKGFTTTLLREDVAWDEATQRDFLKIVDEESDRLGELIDNLLDMSLAEAGALRVDKEPVQIRNIVQEARDRAAPRSRAHWFVVDLPSQLPKVWADPRRIRQVLYNLLENAIKYSPNGGQITITCEIEGEYAVISVADQGEGIPKEYLDRVFDRFFQVDSKSTRKIGGIGLGLSIAKGIVEAHGGQIWAESSPGEGSVFRFTLPLVREGQVSASVE